MRAISISNLRVIRGGNVVLPGLSTTVEAGKVYGLLGPSGCGKSTLMRAIVGVQKIHSGTVRVLGASAGARELRARVGYMTQSASVYTDLTVRENLAYFAAVSGVGRARIDTVIDQVDLAAHDRRVVGTLSGGQRSRVSLAGALLSAPELLVLDEPTVGLDPVLRESLWSLFHDLVGAGATLLVSSHVMDEAARCDHLLLMRDGDLIAELTPDELLFRTGASGMEQGFLRLIESTEPRA